MFVVRGLLIDVVAAAFRETPLLFVALELAEGFEGGAGAAPGALRFFDVCWIGTPGSGCTGKLDNPGIWSFGTIQLPPLEAGGDTAVVRERLRVLTPVMMLSSTCRSVDEAEVEEFRGFFDAEAHS